MSRDPIKAVVDGLFALLEAKLPRWHMALELLKAVSDGLIDQLVPKLKDFPH